MSNKDNKDLVLPPPAQDDFDIQINTAYDENELPGMPELWESVSQRPISPDRLQALRQKYYPNFDDDQIALIEHTVDFSFEKFLLYTRWTFAGQNNQPTITDFGSNPESSLEDRLAAIARPRLNQSNAAFAALDEAENYLEIPSEPGLVDRIATASTPGDTPFVVVDIGCGGQTVDILLLADPRLSGRNIQAVGTGVFDYGRQLRSAFPEFGDRLTFVSDNALSSQLPQSADFVFSTRTVPYTGVVDPVRFCDNADVICGPGGTIWINSIEESSFIFSGTEYADLSAFLDAQRERMPSLRYQRNGDSYSICWSKDEGLPLGGLVAVDMLYNDQQQPYSIRYSIPQS